MPSKSSPSSLVATQSTHDQDSHTDVDRAVSEAVEAAALLASVSRQQRAELLREIAASLDGERSRLVALARRESSLDPADLDAEVTRTVGQLKMFADVVLEGSYLEVATEERSGSPAVRVLAPSGPVAVFGSSNFPFAYGAAGGDAASALAAGCPIVVKVHPGHPETCIAVVEIMRDAAMRCGLPSAVVGSVSGVEGGRLLIEAAGITGVGFTGSTAGGRALFGLCAARPTPIPFYGELGSLNPVLVTPAAARERAAEVGDLLGSSMTTRHGQVCTKPGAILIPAGEDGDHVIAALVARATERPARRLLTDTVMAQFVSGVRALADRHGVDVLGGALPAPGAREAQPVVLGLARADGTAGRGLCEIFGPVTVVIRYDDLLDARSAVDALDPALVGAVQAAAERDADAPEALALLRAKVGRLVWNRSTTGLEVDWATNHSGGFPATTSIHSSVGASAIRRWLTPMSFEGVPDALLPEALRDGALAELPHRRDGAYLLPGKRTGAAQ